MRDLPIPFQPDMTRAIREGRKSQTRRVITDSNSRGNFRASELLLNDPRTFVDDGPSPAGNPGQYLHAYVNAPEIERRKGWPRGTCDDTIMDRLYPWVFPGERLWVREPWRTVKEADALPPSELTAAHRLWFEADAPHQPGFGKYRHARFMCRWMSRILLKVTRVRAQRLQDISAEDALAEGLFVPGAEYAQNGPRAPILAYAELWERINGAGSWALNPWIWAVDFEQVKP